MASETEQGFDVPFYNFIVNTFPLYISPHLRFDVQAFRQALDPVKSHERVYQWLRTGRLMPRNAMDICALANKPEHVAARVEAGNTEEITIRNFDRFVYA